MSTVELARRRIAVLHSAPVGGSSISPKTMSTILVRWREERQQPNVTNEVAVLPILLATTGPKLDWPRNRREAGPSRGWSPWTHLVVRHRWAAAVGSTAVLAALVVAAASIQLGKPARRLARDRRASPRRGCPEHGGTGILAP